MTTAPRGLVTDTTRRSPIRRGFTIVELLVAIAIIGVLLGLLAPAVQSAREASRRVACSNNLRNQVLALHQFHATYNAFPAGRRISGNVEFSWCLEVLPYLEQSPLYSRYDRTTPWYGSDANASVAATVLSIFRCPSSVVEFPGDTDYGGIMGSSLTSTHWRGAFSNGVLIDVASLVDKGVCIGQIIDGTSQTICIAESSDRMDSESGLWISGFNCFSHDNGIISSGNGEIGSLHKGGAFAAFADGSTRFLSNGLEPYVLGAICTRNLGEVVATTDY